MKKKAKKVVTKKVVAKNHPFFERLPRNRGEWLTVCINLTERAMNPNVEKDPMDGQWARLHAELEAFKRDNPTEKIREYVGTKLASEA